MNKKKLIAQNQELYNLVKQHEAYNASLKKRIDELMIMLGAKDFEISELKKEVEELKTANKVVSAPPIITPSFEETIVSNEVVAAPIKAEEPIVLDITEKAKEEAPKVMVEEVPAVKYVKTEQIEDEISKYAAKAISNISLKAAMLSNQLATSGNSNAKDLLTLTLGRSEVFKQKVFEITKSGVNLDSAKASINLLEAETIEYFEQLKAQL